MDKTITLGVTDLSFHRVTASLLMHIFNEMGFEVTRVYSPHQDNFKKLQNAEVDLLTSAWLPSSHGMYKQDVEHVISLTELGQHYAPYALWGGPDYVPIEAVSQVSDLLKSEVISTMQPTIQGINAGAGISRFSIRMMQEYGLTEAGYRFLTGTEEACFSAFEQAVNNKQWVIVPLWKPQFLHYRHHIRELVEPKGLLGGVDKAVLLLRDDKKHLFTQVLLDTLNGVHFSNAIIGALDHQVCRENKPVDEVTKHWLSQHKAIYQPTVS
ncbi:glycine betaine ABC transporter substrate-binding protein [Shewanella surugensis]|uniref:Glycine betaine ABC transporter substrate-binding protein n=1 Tax=Shewanella surugensis TaxID=212020 RepID=A0ABT0LBN0_9GAMM|nr:glycine betaine ABC transporter substrate-binding protein [Shewanella surugensis]MCL1125117.1 glycine betaine ABC transporter substrate-binding protein [Shewanella surugensis]